VVYPRAVTFPTPQTATTSGKLRRRSAVLASMRHLAKDSVAETAYKEATVAEDGGVIGRLRGILMQAYFHWGR